MARPGVRGTFSQPGPSRPAAAVRLTRTLCRTKCPLASSQVFRGTVLAHRTQTSVSRGGSREFMYPKATHASASDERADRASNYESGTLQRSVARHSSRQATNCEGQSCSRDTSSSQWSRARGQRSSHRRWCSPRLARRAAGPWRSPQRRSTAPALPSAETGRFCGMRQRKRIENRATSGAA